MCFVFTWEQTATCATYSVNWLVFITEMKSVYCAVRTGSLNKAVCCIYLRTNSDWCHLQNKLIGFYNRDEKCLLRGTNWVFKWSSLRFVFKGLNQCANLRLEEETAVCVWSVFEKNLEPQASEVRRTNTNYYVTSFGLDSVTFLKLRISFVLMSRSLRTTCPLIQHKN